MGWLRRLFGRPEPTDAAVGHAAGQVAGISGANAAHATDTMFSGMDALKEVAIRLERVELAKRQGNLYEYIEAAKFNADAAGKGSPLRALVTAAHGEPTAPDDLRIMEGAHVVQRVQAKSFAVEDQSDLARLTREISKSKYHDMQKVTNPENVEGVRALAAKRAAMEGSLDQPEYADTVENLSGATSRDGVSSGGTSVEEARRAGTNPRLFAAELNAKQVAEEVATTAGQAAVAAAAMSASIATVREVIGVLQGRQSAGEAAQKVVKEGARGAVRGAAVGTVGSGIRIAASQGGVTLLAQPAVSMAVAAAAVEVGVAVYRFAKGEIRGDELAGEVARTTTSGVASLYLTASAKAALGAVPGGIVALGGYMAASYMYQACRAVIQQAKLAEAEADRLEALSRETIVVLRAEREAFERVFAERLQAKRKEIGGAFGAIDRGLSGGDLALTVEGISQLAYAVHVDLHFQSFSEFDSFMTQTNAPIRL